MNAYAEMIFTGDELLRGDIINTNQEFLGRRLLGVGLFATHALSVVDDLEAISTAIRDSLARRPALLILCGGLGPTDDDLTRDAVAATIGGPLRFHEDLMDEVRSKYAQIGVPTRDSSRRQAYLPAGATAFAAIGTAPGFFTRSAGTLVVALPGPPRELKEMWSRSVEPLLREQGLGGAGADGNHVKVRRLRIFGAGESALADMLKELDWRGSGINIGTRIALEGVTLILRAAPAPDADARLDSVETQVREILGDLIFGSEDDDLAGVTGALVRDRGLTLSTAESCTGGLLAKRVTDIPGSSDYFLGGAVTYSNKLKTDLLGVSEQLLATKGAVSREVALAMAEGSCRRFASSCAIATTGIAGPGGGTPDKPVGLVYLATCVQGSCEVTEGRFVWTRPEIRARATQTALDLLRRRLLREP